MGGVTYTHRLAPNVFLDFDVSQIHNQSDDPGEKYNETEPALLTLWHSAEYLIHVSKTFWIY